MSLDDEGDFGWNCRYCGKGLNVRWLVDVIKVEISGYFTGRDLDRTLREWTYCSTRCRNATYGP